MSNDSSKCTSSINSPGHHTPGNRLFFALWPDDEVRASISSALERFPGYIDGSVSGRPVPLDNLHLTLHFLGQVSQEQQVCMHQAALNVERVPFALRLDRFGIFRRAKVFWLGPDTAQGAHFDALTGLRDDLGGQLETCGYHIENRPYSPHVTLLRKCVIDKTQPLDNVGCEDIWPAGSSITWPVNAFVLARSESTQSGVRYQVVEKYPLS